LIPERTSQLTFLFIFVKKTDSARVAQKWRHGSLSFEGMEKKKKKKKKKFFHGMSSSFGKKISFSGSLRHPLKSNWNVINLPGIPLDKPGGDRKKKKKRKKKISLTSPDTKPEGEQWPRQTQMMRLEGKTSSSR